MQGPGGLGTHSGQEQEDNSPLLGGQSLGEERDPAQGRDMEHLWALGRSSCGTGRACDRIRAARTENRDSVRGDSGVIQPALVWRGQAGIPEPWRILAGTVLAVPSSSLALLEGKGQSQAGQGEPGLGQHSPVWAQE